MKVRQYKKLWKKACSRNIVKKFPFIKNKVRKGWVKILWKGRFDIPLMVEYLKEKLGDPIE